MYNPKVLENSEIKKILKEDLSDWNFHDNKLTLKLKFNSFRSVINLINLVAIEAEVINHHPAYFHNFKTIEFSTTTYSVENKITDLDISIALYISKEAKKIKAHIANS